MAGISKSFAVVLTVFAVLFVPRSSDAAPEEGVDQLTRTALSLDRHPDRGAVLFSRSCARCHGLQGHGDAAQAIPALAGQRFTYLVRQLADFADAERDGADKHRIVARGELRNPQAWADIAAYLSGVPVVQFAGAGDDSQAELGRAIFREQCATCHHGDARGDDDGFVPSLRNQHYSYLAAQLHELAEGRRHNVDENLMRFLRSFDDQDIDATAVYLSRLQDPSGDSQ